MQVQKHNISFLMLQFRPQPKLIYEFNSFCHITDGQNSYHTKIDD